jgi:2-deoxy-D-gluconate 3-dehydrogenase
MDTNLTSAFLCSRAVHPHLQRAGGGKVINIGSMLSIFGAPYASAYGASKGGVVQFTRSLATAWAGDNIQVNAVLPGWIDTELTQGARQQVAGLYERVLARTPAGRWGAPGDLAGSGRVPGKCGVRLHYRHGHPGGRRLFGQLSPVRLSGSLWRG